MPEAFDLIEHTVLHKKSLRFQGGFDLSAHQIYWLGVISLLYNNSLAGIGHT